MSTPSPNCSNTVHALMRLLNRMLQTSPQKTNFSKIVQVKKYFKCEDSLKGNIV